MREYKFRGKRLDTGEWVYGYYFIEERYIEDGIIWRDIPQIQQRYGDHFQYFDVDPATVGQYTGLHDKNGREIYEGDIVLCTMPFESFNAVVEFADGCFEIRSKKWRDYLKVYVANHAVEIIGNRWDNPELLKEGSV